MVSATMSAPTSSFLNLGILVVAQAATCGRGIKSMYSLLKTLDPTLQGKDTESTLSLGPQTVLSLLQQAACFTLVENVVHSMSMDPMPHSFCYTMSCPI